MSMFNASVHVTNWKAGKLTGKGLEREHEFYVCVHKHNEQATWEHCFAVERILRINEHSVCIVLRDTDEQLTFTRAEFDTSVALAEQLLA